MKKSCYKASINNNWTKIRYLTELGAKVACKITNLRINIIDVHDSYANSVNSMKCYRYRVGSVSTYTTRFLPFKFASYILNYMKPKDDDMIFLRRNIQ